MMTVRNNVSHNKVCKVPAKFPLWLFSAAACDAILAIVASNALFLGSDDVFISPNTATVRPPDGNFKSNERTTVTVLNDGCYPIT